MYVCNYVVHTVKNNTWKRIHAVAELLLPQNKDNFFGDVVMQDLRIILFEDVVVNDKVDKDDKK